MRSALFESAAGLSIAAPLQARSAGQEGYRQLFHARLSKDDEYNSPCPGIRGRSLQSIGAIDHL